MNRIIEEFNIPGYRKLAIIVPRNEGNRKNKKGDNKHSLQLELILSSES